MITPPIMSDTEGIYTGADGRPASVGVADSYFQWTVYGRYQSGAECGKAMDQLQGRSLHLNPASATAAAWSFAKCLKDNDPQLKPEQGPTERLPDARSSQSVKNPAQ